MDDLERTNLEYEKLELWEQQENLSMFLKKNWRWLSIDESQKIMKEIQSLRNQIRKIDDEVGV